jgi:putative flavoprotein involved in K+ transport
MHRTHTIVIGAGQAGLAISWWLGADAVDHVVLERGRVAERWRTERWDSLRLLTPNWMSRLPGWRYAGPDPHGYMTGGEVVAFYDAYAAASAAPVHANSPVACVTATGGEFEVIAGDDLWRADNVVIATGWCDTPAVPLMARHLSASVEQLTPSAYRNPDGVTTGGVLVVGASSSGAQLAHELAAAGRHVVLAVGTHARVPRRYRGMDIFWWLEQTGSLSRTIDDLPDPVAARHEPSLQLVGRPDHHDLDLATLQGVGVELVGRLESVEGDRVGLADDLERTVAGADARMRRVLASIDRYTEESGLATEVLDADPPPPVHVHRGATSLNLRRQGINTVVWATGYRRAYPWLHVPVLDRRGEVLQRRGVTPVPGLYVLGQRFQHTRRSNFIDGVGADAAFVAEHLTGRTTSGRTTSGYVRIGVNS